MTMRRRVVTAVVALALAGVPAGCGEDDVDEAGREVKDEAGEVKRDAEKKGREVKTDAEKEIND